MNNKFFEWLDRNIGKQSTWIWLLVIMAALSIGLPLLLTRTALIDGFGFDQSTGVIGDSIGGIVTPTLAFFGILLTFLAFYIQFKANEMQRQNFRTEWFEKVLLSQLESHEKLKKQLDNHNHLTSLTEQFISRVQMYSRRFKEKKFNALDQFNPDKSLHVDEILLSEYFDSILSFIDLIENENRGESVERKKFYVKNLVYRKLDLSERYLLGYYLERKINERLLAGLINYEDIFKDYYLKTEHHLTGQDKLAPEFRVRFDPNNNAQIFILENEVVANAVIKVERYFAMDDFNVEKIVLWLRTSEIKGVGVWEGILSERVFKDADVITVTNHLPASIDLSNDLKDYFGRYKYEELMDYHAAISTLKFRLEIFARFSNQDVFTYNLIIQARLVNEQEGAFQIDLSLLSEN